MLVAMDIIEQFRGALAERGLIPAEIIADGAIHRCRVEGGRMDGSYRLYFDGRPAGWLQNHADGLGVTKWRATGQRLAKVDWERIHQVRRERETFESSRRKLALAGARRMWDEAKPVRVAHRYLRIKRVVGYGTRQLWGQLLVPIRDVQGHLLSLQRIDQSGSKRFIKDLPTKGGMHLIGGPIFGRVVLCEGYATGASLHRLLACPVAVAFDCGNLLPVARSLHGHHPLAQIVVAADDDWMTPNNPGLTKARAVQREIGCGSIVVVPKFPNVNARAKSDSDWNDLVLKIGHRAAKRCLMEQING